MRKKSEKRSIDSLIMMSYVIIALAALILNSIVYYFTLSSAVASMKQPHTEQAAALETELREVFSTAFTDVSDAAKNDQVKALLKISVTDAYRGDDALTMKDTLDFLDQSLNPDIGFRSIILYDVNHVSLLSAAERGENVDDTFKVLHGSRASDELTSLGITEEKLQELGSERKPHAFTVETEEGTLLVYAVNTYLNQFVLADGIVFGVFYLDELQEYAAQYAGDNGTVLLDAGESSAAAENGALTASGVAERLEEKGKDTCVSMRLNGKACFVTRLDLHSDLLTCVYMTTRSSQMNHLMPVLIAMAVNIAGILLMTVIFGIYFTKKSTDPLKRILQQINDGTEVSRDALTFENLEKRVTAVTENARKYESIYRRDFLSLVLNSQVTDEKSITEYENSRLGDTERQFHLIFIRFATDNSRQTRGKEQEEKRNALILYCINNIFREVLEEIRVCDPISSYNGVYFIVRFVPFDQFESAIDRGCAGLKQYFQEKIYIGNSVMFESFTDLPVAKKEADLAAEYAEMNGLEKEVVFYGKLLHAWEQEQDRQASGSNEDRIYFRSIAKMIFANRYAEARAMEEDRWREYTAMKNANPDIWRARMTSVITSIVSGNAELAAAYPLSAVTQMNIPELHQTILTLLDKLEQGKETDKEGRKVFEKIAGYIRENYADPNMNASGIAEEFKLSYSYVSSLFKKNTGETIIDYLNHVRIEKAKELLAEGKTVTEISQILGYLEPRGFIRVFKKYEGITPGQYKKQ